MGFVAMDNKEVEKLIKQIKPITKFEATAILTYDLNFNRERSISEYTRVFGWGSRYKTREFLNRQSIPLISNGSQLHTDRVGKQKRHPKPLNGGAVINPIDGQLVKLPF